MRSLFVLPPLLIAAIAATPAFGSEIIGRDVSRPTLSIDRHGRAHVTYRIDGVTKTHTMTLGLDVFVTPMRPMSGAPAQGPGDEPMWSPMSSTLIHGGRDAVLVDTLVTFDQVDALADWVAGFRTQLIGIYITHGHTDHWVGLSRLRERFGDVPAWARPRFTIAPSSRRQIPDSPPTGRGSSRPRFRSSRQPRTASTKP